MNSNDFGKTSLLQSAVNSKVVSLYKTRSSKHSVNITKTNQSFTLTPGENKILFTNPIQTNQFALVDVNIKQSTVKVPYNFAIDFGQKADGSDSSKTYSTNVQRTIFHQDYRIEGSFMNFNLTNLSDTTNFVCELELYFKNYTNPFPNTQIEHTINGSHVAQLDILGNDYWVDVGARKIGNSKYIKRQGFIDNLQSYPAMIWQGGAVQSPLNTSNVLSTITITTLTTPSALDDGTVRISGYNSFGERENEDVVLVDGTGVSTGTFTLIDLAFMKGGFSATQDITIKKTTGGTLVNYIKQGDSNTFASVYQSPASVNFSVIKDIHLYGFVDGTNPVVHLKWKNVDDSTSQENTLFKTRLVDNNNINLTIPILLKIPPRYIVWIEITTGNTISTPTQHITLNADLNIYEDYNFFGGSPYELGNLPMISEY